MRKMRRFLKLNKPASLQDGLNEIEYSAKLRKDLLTAHKYAFYFQTYLLFRLISKLK